MTLLAELQIALEATGARCVLARRHRPILRATDAPCKPSGPTDPQLHVFTEASTCVATTDGSKFRLSSGKTFAVTALAAVTAAVRGSQRVRTRA